MFCLSKFPFQCLFRFWEKMNSELEYRSELGGNPPPVTDVTTPSNIIRNNIPKRLV